MDSVLAAVLPCSRLPAHYVCKEEGEMMYNSRTSRSVGLLNRALFSSEEEASICRGLGELR